MKDSSSPMPTHLSIQKLKPLKYSEGNTILTFDMEDESHARNARASQAKSLDNERKDRVVPENHAKRASNHVRKGIRERSLPDEEQKVLQRIKRPSDKGSCFESPFNRTKLLPHERERREAIPLREGIIAVLGGGARAMRSKNSINKLQPVSPDEGEELRLPNIQEDGPASSPSPQPPQSTRLPPKKATEV